MGSNWLNLRKCDHSASKFVKINETAWIKCKFPDKYYISSSLFSFLESHNAKELLQENIFLMEISNTLFSIWMKKCCRVIITMLSFNVFYRLLNYFQYLFHNRSVSNLWGFIFSRISLKRSNSKGKFITQ